MLQLLGPSVTLERLGSKVGAFLRAVFALGLEHCLASRFGTVTSQEMTRLPAIALNFTSEEIVTFNCYENSSKNAFPCEIWA